jgi:hypothetical protein
MLDATGIAGLTIMVVVMVLVLTAGEEGCDLHDATLI